MKYALTILCLLVTTLLWGQKTFQPKLDIKNTKGIVYNTENALEYKLHPNGMTLAYVQGKIRTYYRTTYNYYSIGYVHDGREKSKSRLLELIDGINVKPFRFGKRNHVINLRAGRGVRRYLSGERKRRGVAVGYTYQGGLSLAVLNPVHLNLLYEVQGPQHISFEVRKERYSEDNADRFTDINRIYGGTSYFSGFQNLAIRPGIQGSIGGIISMGTYSNYAQILEAGIMADVFIGKLPIMVETENIKNRYFLLNVYVSVLFGRRK